VKKIVKVSKKELKAKKSNNHRNNIYLFTLHKKDMKKITLQNIDDVFKSPKIERETAELQGYELIEELFVDNSGFGTEEEPALTVNMFKKKMKELVQEYGTVYTGITMVGYFQVYVGVFKKAKKSVVKSLYGSKNLKERYENGKRIIRLYDTDIVEFDGRKVVLNSGGWRTETTKNNMNRIGEGKFYVFSENGDWYVKTKKRKMEFPFVDGVEFNI
jgi:hypothetical protein